MNVRLVLAALNLTLVGLAFAVLHPTDIPLHWAGYPLIASPCLLLLLAAHLSRQNDTPIRHGVTTAAVLVLLANLYLLEEFVRYRLFFTGIRPGPFRFGPVGADALAVAQYPTTLTALVPAAVGWWQRRQDRLADPDADA